MEFEDKGDHIVVPVKVRKVDIPKLKQIIDYLNRQLVEKMKANQVDTKDGHTIGDIDQLLTALVPNVIETYGYEIEYTADDEFQRQEVKDRFAEVQEITEWRKVANGDPDFLDWLRRHSLGEYKELYIYDKSKDSDGRKFPQFMRAKYERHQAQIEADLEKRFR